jgi:uncharacterized membrane protein
MADLIGISSVLLSYIGAAIIVYGGALATFKTLKLEIQEPPGLNYLTIRRDFTQRVVFSLDFLVAGDILRTIAAPTPEEVLLLGGIVGIRTVMGYFLTKEVKEFEVGK